MYSALAGFIEPGEDIDVAVRRETMEEAGIEVGEVRFHATQPWPFPHSLMIGCHGLATTTEVSVDSGEIQEARWFPRAEVQLMLDGKHPDGLFVPGRHAIARALITAFVEGRV
jgi:NAD+ diphosphatase